MAGAVPVIASRVEGMAEIFEDGVSGIYVQNEDVQEIAKAVRLVRDAEEYAAQLGKGGLARVQEQFTPEKMAAGSIASYERALA
jgi:glycosyltransferase involved in cell wall biosynthesis